MLAAPGARQGALAAHAADVAIERI